MSPKNPFRPGFGVRPPILVGRDELIERFQAGIEEGPGAPARATLYTGARGSGKTVLLTAAENWARSSGWLVISETANPGFLRNIVIEHLPRHLLEQGLIGPSRHVTGITAPMGLGGVTWDRADPELPVMGLRTQIEVLTDHLAEHGSGLLITLDELHHRAPDEFRALAAAIQHAFREERELAFAGAGLPWAISGVLSDEVLTFLRRADRHVLGAVSFDDVIRALRGPIESVDRVIAPADLERAAEATYGYPYLIQLIGYHIFRQHPERKTIDAQDVTWGIQAAVIKMSATVHDPALADIDARDRAFVEAMSNDDGPSRVNEVAVRVGVDLNEAIRLQSKLGAAQLVADVGDGRVDFAIPYLREHLRGQLGSGVDLLGTASGRSGWTRRSGTSGRIAGGPG